MTCDGAEFSHRYYEKLIAHYNFNIGAVRPEEGLDDVGRGIVAELLMYAADGFGHILDRAIAEAGIAAPDVSLTLESVIATLNIPAKWIEKKLTNAEDRRIVQAMYDELQATGKVEHSLPEDDRVIRDLHKREVLERAKEVQLDKRAVRVPDGDPAEARRMRRVVHAKGNIVKPVAFAGTLDAAAVPVPAATQKKAVKRIEIEAELLPEADADPAPAPSRQSTATRRRCHRRRRLRLANVEPEPATDRHGVPPSRPPPRRGEVTCIRNSAAITSPLSTISRRRRRSGRRWRSVCGPRHQDGRGFPGACAARHGRTSRRQAHQGRDLARMAGSGRAGDGDRRDCAARMRSS